MPLEPVHMAAREVMRELVPSLRALLDEADTGMAALFKRRTGDAWFSSHAGLHVRPQRALETIEGTHDALTGARLLADELVHSAGQSGSGHLLEVARVAQKNIGQSLEVAARLRTVALQNLGSEWAQVTIKRGDLPSGVASTGKGVRAINAPAHRQLDSLGPLLEHEESALVGAAVQYARDQVTAGRELQRALTEALSSARS